ncbi:MAG TPA: LD-carboxypeptidase [Vicinamibacterales bacterium]
MHRRTFLGSAAAALGAASFGLPSFASAQPSVKPVKPTRLSPGDTVALVAPANATFNSVDLQIAKESLEALGFKVKVGGHVLDRHGYMAGQDKDRAADINAFFADPSIRAVLPLRGGWGSSRVLPYLDFDVIRKNPKVVLGYSDITALLLSIHAKTGLVTFHGPNGMGRWDEFSVDYFKRMLMQGDAITFENPRKLSDKNVLTQTENRIQTITGGKARGRLLGGNLTVLTTIIGSPYLPQWDGAIFFCEDVSEGYYRIDRMLTQLKLAGVLSKIKGFVFGTCSECDPGDNNFGALTFEEIFADHIKPLGVPAWSGAMIGHGMPQWTLAEGIEVEVDADAGTVRMLEPGVA